MDIIIYLLVFLPIFASALIFSPVIPEEERIIRNIARFFAYSLLTISIVLCIFFDFLQPDNTMEVSFPWINTLGINVSCMADSLSVILLVISSFIFLTVFHISKGTKAPHRLYYSLILCLQTSANGMILSKDMFLFIMFSALGLIPTFILINKWGSINREKTAFKYFLYKITGLSLILISFLLIYFINFKYTGILSSDLNDIEVSLIPDNIKQVILICLLIGFFFNLPVVPFHRWLSETLTNSSAGLSIIISSIMFSGFAFGFIRYVYIPFNYEIFEISLILCLISAFTLLYAALVILKENNLKQIISYSSLIFSGLFLLGLSSANITGIIGAISGLLFYLFAISGLYITEQFIYKGYGTDNINKIQGLYKNMPRLMLLSIIFLSIMPLLCGYTSFILCTNGAFFIDGSGFLNAKLLVIITVFAIGMFIGKYIYIFCKIFTGKNLLNRKISDIKIKPFLIMLIIVLAIAFLSIFLFALTDIFQMYISQTLNQAELFNGIN